MFQSMVVNSMEAVVAFVWKAFIVTAPVWVGYTIGRTSDPAAYKHELWRWFWFCVGLLAAASWTVDHWNT
jgi:hypothetical protein